ncbi:ubiquinol-cytochrome C reductase hinge protein-domain-containing protein [Catenaria anguillulae PL171]|uniref:Ubiquinol-cytochrome C reductase hinge protein-domain-containing protein n=1 Tax=Catenaria anguillulae PL171 TaxID=765915 RepID=A0A1Y2I2S9_9FUNG|nr:ubiquinol-cytochrome C reductase hinge protein-domain-containing protein [Catenaria anguillulae PL171]
MSAIAEKAVKIVHCEEEEAEEVEISDPKEQIAEECRELPSNAPLREALEACTARVEAGAEETCVEEFFKLQKAVDQCTAASLFTKLK